MSTLRRKGLTAALLGVALLAGGGVLLTCRTGAAAPEDKKAKSDQEKLQGTWVAKSGEKDGEKLNEFQLKNWEQMVFTDDKFTREGGEKREGAYKLDPDQKPKEIDLMVNGNTWMGIYELKGTALKLVIKVNGRPTEFNSKGAILIVFEKK
jgi:uncharacterized protein (TIGR03067 family)